MPTLLRRSLRHARRGLSYTCALVLILLGIAVAVADRLLPLVQEHPDRIAAWLIARSGRPVHFDHAEAHWTNRGPVFALYNLRIGEGSQQLAVDRAELLVAMYSGWLPDHPFTELRLHGLVLTIERDATGRWHLVGLSGPREEENHDPLDNLQGLGELQVTDARLTLRSPAQGFAFTLPSVALRLRVSEKSLRAGVRVDVASGSPILATLDFDRRSNNGTLWVGGEGINLTPWSPVLGYAGVQIAGGHGSFGVWSTLQDRRVVSVQVETQLSDVALRSHAPLEHDGQTSVLPQVALSSLGLSARFVKFPGGWDVVVPRLRLRTAAGEDAIDGVVIRSANDLLLVVPKVDVGALLSIAMLSDHVSAGLREWMIQAAPMIRASGLRVGVSPDGELRGQATLDNVSWQPVGETLGVHGAAGTLLFDSNAIALTFAPPDSTAADPTRPGPTGPDLTRSDPTRSDPTRSDETRSDETRSDPTRSNLTRSDLTRSDQPEHGPAKDSLQLLWPAAFGPPVPLEMQGSLIAWRDGKAWTLESSNLRAHNDDLTLDTRLSMHFKADGSKPRLDLFSTIQPAPMQVAKRYWIRHRMPASTIDWLDHAIEGGEVAGAHVIVAGDLADWPFKHNEGRFEAVADLVDAPVHFSPEWPRADHVTGRLVFEDDGMRLEGSASVLGIKAPQLSAEIPNFHAPILEIHANLSGSGAQMLTLMRQSPLQKRYAETFNALDVQGDAQRATLHLLLPLRHELGESRVDGDILFDKASLSDSRWNLAFTDVAGDLHYDQNGVLADALNVRLKGDPATFHLAVGGATGNPALAVAAQLRGSFPIGTLLEHAPSLDWLKPIIDGRSAWTVGVQVPVARDSAHPTPTQLSVQSDLRGSSLKLPTPLAKSADEALALQVNAPLPVDAGELNVTLGDLLSVRGRYDDNSQAFRGLLTFGGSSAGGALPTHGVAVGGHVEDLDAAAWVAFASTGAAGPSGLQSVDVQADSLALGGRHFAHTRVRMARQADITTLRLDSDAIAGSITVPTELARGIRGQFDRLYWPGSSSTPNGGLVASADTDIDPGTVPSLHLDVTDLRFGDAKLGHLVLQTKPMAQGLHIDQLDASASSQTVTATGDWVRSGTGTRTRLAIGFQADSLGKMLDAFGFKGVVDAGKTQAKLQASWTGSPTAFRMAVLDGTLDLDVGSGRLLEVKPGAGRVLGLVSLAELPRRLGLDFHDFFDKGFSFDSLKGRFVFTKGVARTDDLTIKGPAAEIKVIGSADLVAQRYDQTIDVLPRAGGLVTAVGAIAGGPVGAAVGAVAGEVLKHPLQQMARKRYHVTGPWSSPDVQTIRVNASATAPSQPVSG